MKTKQILVLRKDLKMRKGKMIAQGAHAAMKVFFDRMIKTSEDGLTRTLTLDNQSMADWVDGSFTKIALGVNSEEELDDLFEKANTLGVPCTMIVDNGLTEFHGVKTKTCIAIGPADAEIIDTLTSHLELL